jgi:hypothetical protein
MGLTAGPHLPVTARQNERGGGASWAGGRGGLGRCGLPARARRKAAGLGGLRAERGVGIVGEKREGEGEGFLFFFLFKFFSNSFFKLSNFNQTEIHAFES